jgi:hypothetical protein
MKSSCPNVCPTLIISVRKPTKKRGQIMRDFFIKALELLISIFIVLAGIGVVVAAGMATFGGDQMSQQMGGGGPLVGIGILIGGFLYLVFLGGFMYLGLGIYQNTKRTADAIERMAGRS